MRMYHILMLRMSRLLVIAAWTTLGSFLGGQFQVPVVFSLQYRLVQLQAVIEEHLARWLQGDLP